VACLPDGAYREERKAFFGSIHRTLNHLLVVDRLWTGRIRGTDRGIRALDQVLYDDLAALRAARADEDRQLVELVDGLSAPQLAAPVRYRRIIGEAWKRPGRGTSCSPCSITRPITAVRCTCC